MLARFLEQTRTPRSLAEKAGVAAGAVELSNASLLRNGTFPARIQRLSAKSGHLLPADLDDIVHTLRFEKYIDNSLEQDGTRRGKPVIRKIYYSLRPLFPVAFRKHLQRIALKDWDKKAFPAWPVDFTVEDIFEWSFSFLLRALDCREIPFIWYWPDGHSGGCVMTHDVETKAGRDFCETIMEMEHRYEVRSSFELVPEKRYDVSRSFIDQITGNGCEVCVHGLNHDGRLFSSEELFLERAKKINQYADKWGAVGFRSPVMYRNLDWFDALSFSYDMSVPNVGHLDPQPGGCCTVMPYFIGDVLELPLTATQDYPLYHILKQRSLGLWKDQIGKILHRHGLVTFIIHPDYTTSRWATHLYESLLEYLAELRTDRGLWIALPREVDAWWRDRQRMELVNKNGEWCVTGTGSDRARVAYASVENGELRYRLETAKQPALSPVACP